VEIHLRNLAQELVRQGDHVHVLAPAGSVVEGVQCTTVSGQPPQFAQTLDRQRPIEIPIPSVLATLWETAFAMQAQFDLIINWAYDWLPFYLTRFFTTPVAHFVSMGSLTDAMDATIQQTLADYPGRVALYTRTQAATFKFAQGQDPFFHMVCGLDLSHYTFVPHRDGPLCWIGRISPEKGLEDCAAVAQACQIPVIVLGRMQDLDYWQQVKRQYPDAPLEYRGFFPTQAMQQIVGQCRALLMTPKWIEAFGIVVVEALACGVPVISYRRGGPAEIVQEGKTGWLVPADNVSQMIAAIAKIPLIDRHTCRQEVEAHYSLQVMTEQFHTWANAILGSA
jgi:UDP-glucose:tetrahydrobiopterin glucosyltransferase